MSGSVPRLSTLWRRRLYTAAVAVVVIGAWWAVYMNVAMAYNTRVDAEPFGNLARVLTGLGVGLLLLWPNSARADSLGKALRLVLGFILALLWFIIYTID